MCSFQVAMMLEGEGETGRAQWESGCEWRKQDGEWRSLGERMVKIYVARLKQKAELGFVMKSGWVESDRRTTLLWHMFGRCAGRNGASQQAIASPRQVDGRHRTSHDVPGGPASRRQAERRPTARTKRRTRGWTRARGHLPRTEGGRWGRALKRERVLGGDDACAERQKSGEAAARGLAGLTPPADVVPTCSDPRT